MSSLSFLIFCHVNSKLVPKWNSEIKNFGIGNSDFHREMPHVRLHVLYCSIGSNNATLKSEIKINSDFRIPLCVLTSSSASVFLPSAMLTRNSYKVQSQHLHLLSREPSTRIKREPITRIKANIDYEKWMRKHDFQWAAYRLVISATGQRNNKNKIEK